MSPPKLSSKRSKKVPPILPVVSSRASPPLARSRTAKWRAAALIAVHLVIAIHIAHWLTSGSTVTPVEPSEAIAFARSGMVNAGLIFFAATILLTAVFGRFFCGWACHLVALQDLSRWLLLKLGIRPRPLRSRLLAWVPAIAFAYMFLWPVAYRIWIGDDLGVRGYEMTTAHFWATFPGWIVGALTFVICGFAAVWFLGAKGFCTYACPYGAIYSAAERLAPLRVRVTDACQGCGHCTARCSSNVRVHEEVATWGMVTDPGCMRTGDCVSVCPNDALYFGFGRLPAGAPARAEPRRRRPALAPAEELVAGLAFAAAFFAFRGLFGVLPFLLSLGLAGVLAWCALLALRLARRPDLAWRHVRLRSRGRLTPAGRAAATVLVLLGLATAAAGALRATAALAERDFRRTDALRARLLDVTSPVPELDDAERTAARTALARWEAVDRRSPLPWFGAAARKAPLLYLLGDASGFRVAAEEARRRGEETYELARLEARFAAESGDPGGALRAGESAIALRPDLPESWDSLGVLLARAGALAPAADVLERGLARFPDSVDLLYDFGVVSAYRGRPERAIAAFERVLELDPGHREAAENLAGTYASQKRFDEAIPRFRQALERQPGDLELRLLLARALLEAGRTVEARAEIDRVLDRAPDLPEARDLLARATALSQAPSRTDPIR
ncbi:MAG TPA: tetratricopeptide repeat protein [Thermoanaerobaculia bacterium]|nr:tetratricopeptide repeat protein [Thermoanaerobaculia bacterium]